MRMGAIETRKIRKILRSPRSREGSNDLDDSQGGGWQPYARFSAQVGRLRPGRTRQELVLCSGCHTWLQLVRFGPPFFFTLKPTTRKTHGAKSAIGWTDNTFNSHRGCLKVSTACLNCYADSLNKRNPKSLGVFGTEAAGGTRVVSVDKYWNHPLKWDAEAFRDWKLYQIVHDQRLTTEQITTLSEQKRAGERLMVMQNRGLVEQRWLLWHPVEYHSPCVFSASLSDVFEDWSGPMQNHRGERLFWPEYSLANPLMDSRKGYGGLRATSHHRRRSPTVVPSDRQDAQSHLATTDQAT